MFPRYLIAKKKAQVSTQDRITKHLFSVVLSTSYYNADMFQENGFVRDVKKELMKFQANHLKFQEIKNQGRLR